MALHVIEEILSQHAEEVAILWSLRDLAVAEPHYRLSDLARLEARLLSHLDGLLIAENDGWRASLAELSKFPEPGEVFVAAMLAWPDSDESKARAVIQHAQASRAVGRAVVSSLGWLTAQQADPWTDRLLLASSTSERHLGIAACAVRGRHPGKHLIDAVSSADTSLQARGLRAIGELASKDLLPVAQQRMESEEPRIRFSAAWAVARLGADEQALDVLSETAIMSSALSSHHSPGNDSSRALQLVLRRMRPPDAAAWLNSLAQHVGLIRPAVIGTGIIGVTESIPWLLHIMQTPALARVAGEAFTMITGLDLAAEKFDAPWPAGFHAGPTEDPADNNVTLDEDENLPWPDAEKLTDWWQKHASEFLPGTRYLCGQPMGEDWLEHVLRHGYQRQRAAAALELALLRPDQPLFNVRAPGHRQQELLGLR